MLESKRKIRSRDLDRLVWTCKIQFDMVSFPPIILYFPPGQRYLLANDAHSPVSVKPMRIPRGPHFSTPMLQDSLEQSSSYQLLFSAEEEKGRSQTFDLLKEAEEAEEAAMSQAAAAPRAIPRMGRSFRCSWGPNGELVRPWAVPASSSTPLTAVAHVIKMDKLHTLDASNETTQYTDELEVQLEACEPGHLTAEETSTGELPCLPRWQLPLKVENKDQGQLVSCIHRYMGKTEKKGHRHLVWKLVNALFGQVQ